MKSGFYFADVGGDGGDWSNIWKVFRASWKGAEPDLWLDQGQSEDEIKKSW